MALGDPGAPVKPFFRVVTPAQAREALGESPAVGTEEIEVEACAGRVLAATLRVPEDQPAFHRAHMDGYAVRARDTFGASSSIPAYLRMTGAVEMGRAPTDALKRGCAMRIARFLRSTISRKRRWICPRMRLSRTSTSTRWV